MRLARLAGSTFIIGLAISASRLIDGRAAGPAGEPVTEPVALEWSQAIYGARIGFTALETADLDGDGSVEIVTETSSETRWYVLTYQNGAYVHRWISPAVTGTSIGALVVAQGDSDPALEVFVSIGSQIHAYDGATFEEQPLPSIAAGNLVSFAVADVDSNGSPDLVYSASGSLHARDLATGAERHYTLGPGAGPRVAIGQLDHDAALEIVVSGTPGRVIDGATGAEQQTFPAGLGPEIRAADIDRDGIDEVVSGGGFMAVDVYEAATGTRRHTVPASCTSLRTSDVDADGVDDLLCSAYGGLRAFAFASGAPLWSVETPGDWVGRAGLANLDEDAEMEIVWGTHSGPLTVADAGTRVVEWQDPRLYGPFFGLDFGDVDADGGSELLYVSNRDLPGDFKHRLLVRDGATRALEYESPAPSESSYGAHRVRHANVDEDPQAEIFVAAGNTLVCYDGLTHAEQWRATASHAGVSFHSLQVADLFGDGTPEVIVGEWDFAGNDVYAYDGATGAPRMQWSVPVDGLFGAAFLRVADVWGDAQPEIVVGNELNIAIIAPTSGMITHRVPTPWSSTITSLETFDRDGDGRSEIIVGRKEGEIQVLDAATGGVVEAIAHQSGAIHGLTVRDIDGDGSADYLYARQNQLRLMRGAGAVEATLTGAIGKHVGEYDSLLVGDVDGDGRLEVMVGVDESGLMVFELPEPVPTPTPTPTETPEPTPTETPTPAPTPSAATITVNGSTAPIVVAPGATVSVTVSGGPAFRHDWIARYVPTAASTQYLPDYVYLSGTKTPPAVGLSAATVSFTMPGAPGTYNFRFLENNSFKVLATSANVTVAYAATPTPTPTPTTGPTATPAPPATLLVNGSSSPITVTPGETVAVSISGGSASPYDWVGRYDAGVPSEQHQPDYVYLSGTKTPPVAGLSSATVSFTLSALGTYDFRLLSNNTFTVLGTSPTVTVAVASTPTPTATPTPSPTPTAGPPAVVLVNGSATPITVARGSTVTVSITDGPGFARDWVAKYDVAAPNNLYHFDYQYLNGAKTAPPTALTSATLTFTMPTAPGTYNFRLLKDNSFVAVATSAAVTVP